MAGEKDDGIYVIGIDYGKAETAAEQIVSVSVVDGQPVYQYRIVSHYTWNSEWDEYLFLLNLHRYGEPTPAETTRYEVLLAKFKPPPAE